LNTSRELEKILPPGSIVAGQWAPELCLETSHRAIPLWKGFVNSDNPFEKYKITHVLSWNYSLGDELQLQRQWFPDTMKSARHIKTFRIKRSPVILWEVDAVQAGKNQAALE